MPFPVRRETLYPVVMLVPLRRKDEVVLDLRYATPDNITGRPIPHAATVDVTLDDALSGRSLDPCE